MPRISLATVDTAGGLISNSRGIAATINGKPIAVRGDSVAAHPPCPTIPVHCSATTTASPRTSINGIPITLQGDPATCGHGASASAASSIDPT